MLVAECQRAEEAGILPGYSREVRQAPVEATRAEVQHVALHQVQQHHLPGTRRTRPGSSIFLEQSESVRCFVNM